MGGLVDTLFGGGQGQAYSDLQKYIGQGMGERKKYEQGAEDVLSPYLNQHKYEDLFTKALSQGQNPGELFSNLMSGYQQSPFAKAQTEAGMNSIQHALASQGLHGSGDELRALQENAQKISSGDMQNYLQNLLGIRGQYLSGLQGLQGQESGHEYGARTGIGGYRNALGGNLAQDIQSQGAARANEDIGRASGWNKLFSLGLNAGTGMGGGIGHFFQGLSDLF
jgi:hypothetical protein